LGAVLELDAARAATAGFFAVVDVRAERAPTALVDVVAVEPADDEPRDARPPVGRVAACESAIKTASNMDKIAIFLIKYPFQFIGFYHTFQFYKSKKSRLSVNPNNNIVDILYFCTILAEAMEDKYGFIKV
jgi:hypothetical protein